MYEMSMRMMGSLSRPRSCPPAQCPFVHRPFGEVAALGLEVTMNDPAIPASLYLLSCHTDASHAAPQAPYRAPILCLLIGGSVSKAGLEAL